MIFSLKDGRPAELREAVPSDAEDMIDYLRCIGGESDFLTFGKDAFSMSAAEEEAYIKSFQSSNRILLVVYVHGQLAAMGNLTVAEAPRLCHTSELSISARKSYWGTGIAQALMEQLLQFARNSKQIQVIGLTVNAENVRAIRLYQRYGFQEVGCYPRFFHLEDGRFVDAKWMNLYL